MEERRACIEPGDEELSLVRQCQLLAVSRSGWYYEPAGPSALNLVLMNLLDQQFTARPFYGVRRMTVWLRQLGWAVNGKRVRRLMRLMGLEPIYPKPCLSQSGALAQRFPYLLGGVEVRRPDQVWSTDITYIGLVGGFVYLVVVLDWFSRYVLSWRLSNSLDSSFCLEALEEALRQGRPEIFNSDQGTQFTSQEFVARLQSQSIQISWDGRGRAFDNIFVERFWRTVKYEEVYPGAYASVLQARAGLGRYLTFYNQERPHQGLAYRTPAMLYCN